MDAARRETGAKAFLRRIMLDYKTWPLIFLNRFVKPGEPRPLLLEALVTLKMAGPSPIQLRR